LALTGQSPNLAPADKTLYALRDVTATVGSIPLIVSSILSKKIAGGADTIVLDVKCGSGAFMTSLDQARELAKQLVETGSRLGLGVKVSISDMSQPLGSAIGNAIEVVEAFDVLHGGSFAPPTSRFRDLCLHYSGETLEACGKVSTFQEGVEMAREALESEAALDKFKEWVLAQGGDPFWDRDNLPHAPITHEVLYDGPPAFVNKLDASSVGQGVIDLGGGRKTKDDEIDLGVGIQLHVCVGDRVRQGDILFTAFAATRSQAEAVGENVQRSAFGFQNEPVARPPLVLQTL
jgi:pyrimidine-nucleoside phosphorylase